MDIETARLLVSGAGWDLLQALPPYDESTSLALGEGLRATGLDPAVVAAVLTQSRLRARATEKFGEFAGGMLFTTDGLEQATRLPIAARHAQRFAAGGIDTVFDLGCGIGSDAMALASLDLTVHAVDADPVTALVAATNLRHFEHATAVAARAEDIALRDGPTVGAWLDPARRVTGVADIRGRTKRTFSLDALSPSWVFVQDVASRVPATGAKLSPAFPHAAIPAGAEAQWTSWDGEVLECAVWWGPLARNPGRTAAALGSRGASLITESDAAHAAHVEPVLTLGDLGSYLHEADKAVIRAGLGGALVAATDGRPVTQDGGYVTSSAASGPAWARSFRIIEAMPLSTKPLAAWLRARGVTRVTIKKREVDLDPDLLRRQLKLPRKGDGSEATLVLTRVGGRLCVLVVESAVVSPDGRGDGQ